MNEKAKSREAILATASRLFFTQGYHGTGLNQIVKESGSPKGLLYYYFPDGKEELALACINSMNETVKNKYRTVFEQCNDPAEALQLFMRQAAEEMLQSKLQTS